MKTVIHILFSVFMLCMSTTSAGLSEVHKNSLNTQLKSYCKDLAPQDLQEFNPQSRVPYQSSIIQVTCSYNPFSACEFAVACDNTLMIRLPPGAEIDLYYRSYRILEIYKDKKDALKRNKSLNVYTLSVDSENYYVAHSIHDLYEEFW